MKVEERIKLVKPVNRAPVKIKGMEKPKPAKLAENKEAKELEKNRANSKDHTETCEAVEAANKTLTMNSYHLKFRIDKESERIQVKLYDDETNKLIKEIPPDVMLELSARIKRIIETHRKWIGVLVDEVA